MVLGGEMTYELSILIPSRNEAFLLNTIQDILANRRAKTEIIVVLDGAWPVEPIPDHPDVTLIYHPESIGQRAACNEAARVSTAKYVCKVDAHCSFDEGFDVKMLADMQDDFTMVPIMRNLHVFDFVCKQCGWRRYQGQTPAACPECHNPTLEKEIVWRAKPSPQSKSYCFDSTPHFQYFGEYSKRPEGQGDLTETMSLQGSCFLMTRDKYFELGMNDESFGSWGSQGIEVACKTWLSGGRVVVNHKTFYGHMFRGKDWGFPYNLPRSQQEHAQAYARSQFFYREWGKAIKPLSWLLEKFWPIPGWSEDDLAAQNKREGKSKKKPQVGVVYYTDNRLDKNIAIACLHQIRTSINGHELVSVGLRPLHFGRNITLDKEPSYLTLFEQILAGLEASTADVIYLTEHDVLYSPEHFQFTPPDKNKIYYNQNVWQVRVSDGFAVYYEAKRLSQLVAYRDVLIEHYRKRVALVKEKGFSRKMGFEPGSHGRAERVDDLQSEYFISAVPNLDLKHGQNLTPARWSPEQFRDKRNCQGWQESDGTIPGWGEIKTVLQTLGVTT